MKKTLNNIRQIKLLFIIGVMVISYECVINSQDCHHYSNNSEKVTFCKITFYPICIAKNYRTNNVKENFAMIN